MFYKKAFSLTEVLLTLVIIGVIAAMMIPSVLSDVEKRRNIESWKNLYSEVAQATNLVMLDNSGSLVDVCTSWDDNCLRDKYKKYMNVMKSCDESGNLGVCWHPNDNSSKMLDGEGINWWSSSSGLIQSNGSFVNFNFTSNDCSSTYGTLNTCGFILVDVNGFGKPNVLGKDIFQIWLLKYGVKPRGVDDGYQNSCNSNSSGWSCAAEYMYN